MGFLRKIWQGIASPTQTVSGARFVVPDGNGMFVFVQCDRCKEKIRIRLRKTDELQRIEGANGAVFFVRKMVVGTKCFNRMDTTLEFDARYNIVKSNIGGGHLISEQEYESEENKSNEE